MKKGKKSVPDGASRPPGQSRSEGKASHVTSAVGLAETAGRARARRSSLFTQSMVWVTGLVCSAFLLGSLVQVWSNSQLAQTLQQEQQKTQKLQRDNNSLVQQVKHYQDPYVIEEEARQQLGYARPGEHIVVVTGSSDQNQPPSSTSTASASPNFWQAWWDLFFGSQ